MENFYLEKPSLKRKEEIIEYLKELDTYNSDINGIEMLYKIYEGIVTIVHKQDAIVIIL